MLLRPAGSAAAEDASGQNGDSDGKRSRGRPRWAEERRAEDGEQRMTSRGMTMKPLIIEPLVIDPGDACYSSSVRGTRGSGAHPAFRPAMHPSRHVHHASESSCPPCIRVVLSAMHPSRPVHHASESSCPPCIRVVMSTMHPSRGRGSGTDDAEGFPAMRARALGWRGEAASRESPAALRRSVARPAATRALGGKIPGPRGPRDGKPRPGAMPRAQVCHAPDTPLPLPIRSCA